VRHRQGPTPLSDEQTVKGKEAKKQEHPPAC
jgi:hypothetical protein